ncbi:hypothetical protein GCM10010498_11120 [Streptomyces cavourensis]|nr:hypothetical protein GCM10010498_11120 [Streptomyces cavourensis]
MTETAPEKPDPSLGKGSHPINPVTRCQVMQAPHGVPPGGCPGRPYEGNAAQAQATGKA